MRNALNDTAELNLLLTCTSEQTVKTYPGRETKRFFIKKNLSQISIITCVMPSCVERMVSTGAVKVITEIINVKKLPKLKDELRNKLSLCNGWSSAIPLHPLSRTDQKADHSTKLNS